MSRALRPIACVIAFTALAAAVLVVVLSAVATRRGIDGFGPLAGGFFLLGVAAPACVGLFLVLRRPRTEVPGGSDIVVRVRRR